MTDHSPDEFAGRTIQSGESAAASDVVFVYGTLTDEAHVANLLDTYRFLGSAVCLGLQRIDGRYPTLVPGDRVAGRLLETPETDRLDAYEGVDRGLYVRVSVPVDGDGDTVDGVDDGIDHIATELDGIDTASVYIGEPSRLGIDLAAVSTVDQTGSNQLWPPGDSFADRAETYRRSADVRIVTKSQPDDP